MPATWADAWANGDPAILQGWFQQNTGPTVALNPTPLVGVQTVDSQAAADALAGRIIDGSIQVTADNVTLNQFLLRGDGSRELVSVIGVRANLKILDAEIDGQGQKNSIAIGGASYATPVTVERVNIHGVGFDGLRLMTGGTYRHVYIHDLWRWDDAVEGRPYNPTAVDQSTDPHTDGMQSVRGGGLIEQCWIDNQGIGADNATSAIMIKPDAGPIDGWTIRQNYLNGGGYTVHVHNENNTLGSPGPNGDPTNIVIDSNRLGRGYRLGLWSSGDVPPANITRTNNVWADTLSAAPTQGGPL